MSHLFFIQTLLLAAVASIHIAALHLHLYWLFPWLDVIVHLAGAAWVSLATVWILVTRGQRISFARVGTILAALSIGWELFEVWGGIPREANFVFDTAIDLLSDTVGGVVGYIVAEHFIRRATISSHEEDENHSPESRRSS